MNNLFNIGLKSTFKIVLIKQDQYVFAEKIEKHYSATIFLKIGRLSSKETREYFPMYAFT